MTQTTNQKRRVETTLRNQPFYCIARAKYGKGVVFAVYRIIADLHGKPCLMRIGELGSIIYNQKVVEFIRHRLSGYVIEGRPTWDVLCGMGETELRNLITLTDTDITKIVMVAKEVAGK